MTAIRKLAVIFAGDVVGYSRLVGIDEEDDSLAQPTASDRNNVRLTQTF